ncbi:hypothetical protein NDU88_005255 [Pleurodeles waltl]|uniref:Uncharacterized protein n=1 Tax=Pleurodeles waltl TaxID=8319 RepID=A0AAV7LTC6_PLEWA|nr:hypothetical protein NDU88_005255 [Pleurodeles waltl]
MDAAQLRPSRPTHPGRRQKRRVRNAERLRKTLSPCIAPPTFLLNCTHSDRSNLWILPACGPVDSDDMGPRRPRGPGQTGLCSELGKQSESRLPLHHGSFERALFSGN